LNAAYHDAANEDKRDQLSRELDLVQQAMTDLEQKLDGSMKDDFELQVMYVLWKSFTLCYTLCSI
jgi:hypothetical protein